MPEEPQLNDYPAWSREEMVPFLPRDAQTILDVGCGPGAFGVHLRDRTAFGLEPNPAAASEAMAHYADVYVGVFPDDVPADMRFDCIVFNDVLEHMVDPWAALSAARQMLTPHGVVVASIPNMRYMRVLKRLVVNADWTYTEFGVLDKTHLRWFTHRTMRRLFEDSGFALQRMEPINVLPGWKAKALRAIPPLADLPAQQFAVVARPTP